MSDDAARLSAGPLLASNIVATAAGAGGSIVLARLFSPDAFGVLGALMAIMAIGVPVVTLRLDQAIVVSGDTPQTVRAVASSLAVGAGLAFSATGWWLLTVAAPSIAPPFAVVVAGVITSALFSIGWHEQLDRGDTRRMAYARSLQALGALVLPLALVGHGDVALSVGYVVSFGIGVVVLGGARRGFAPPSVVVETLARHRAFPLHVAPAALVGLVSGYLPTVLVGTVFGAAFAGHYSLAFRVAFAPTAVISQAIYQVTFRTFSSSRADERVDIAWEVAARGFRSTWLPSLAVALTGERLFSLVFGPAWDDAGRLVVVLVPWLAVVFIATPITALPVVDGRTRGNLLAQLGVLILRVGSFIAAARYLDRWTAIGVFSAASTLGWVCYLAWILGRRPVVRPPRGAQLLVAATAIAVVAATASADGLVGVVAPLLVAGSYALLQLRSGTRAPGGGRST